MEIKLGDLTASGWILAIITLIVTGFSVYISGRIFDTILPEGTYPVILLAAPGLLVGFAFFYFGSAYLAEQGYPVTKKSEESFDD